MRDRLELHEVLCVILGSRNVYFQPPESVKLKYPAIVYERSNIKNYHANNHVFIQSRSYTVTVIDKNPDSEIVGKLSTVQNCAYDRSFKSDNLNHDVFTIYY